MTWSAERLVERVQRQLRVVQLVSGSVFLSSRDVAELEARVQALSSIGHPFDHVSLFLKVRAACGTGDVLCGVGGMRVATEV